MKKLLIFSALQFSLFHLCAQRFTAGLQLNIVRYHLEGVVNTSTGNTTPLYERSELNASGVNFNGTFGYNPAILKFGDDASLGLSVNAGIGYLFVPKLEGLDASYVINFPEYITFRMGRNSTKNSTKNLGFGLGVGYDYSFGRLPYGGVSVMGEIALKKVTFRVNACITKWTYYSDYTSEGLKPTVTVRPMGLSLLVPF
jgi:hypothetical protein